MTDDMRQVIYLNKVLTMVENSIMSPRKIDQSPNNEENHEEETQECSFCEQQVPCKEIQTIEFENRSRDACERCLANLPEEWPEDEDQHRGDR